MILVLKKNNTDMEIVVHSINKDNFFNLSTIQCIKQNIQQPVSRMHMSTTLANKLRD